MNGDNYNTKRARITSPIRPNDFHITNLPNGIFADVASYLPKPSRALFAIAMTAKIRGQTKVKSIKTSLVSQTILSSTNWESLDFGDIERSLSKRLTDYYIGLVLVFIKAEENLKSLSLTGCVNINGISLDLLKRSTVLEKIDLSLVGYNEKPDIEPPPKISESCVLPIMDTIISNPNNSIKYIQLPQLWRHDHEYEVSSTLTNFLDRYHNLLESRRLCCCKCDTIIQHGNNEHDEEEPNKKWYETRDCSWYGSQNHTCCKCMNYFCDEHSIPFCVFCQRDFCSDCVNITKFCNQCEDGICIECGDLSRCGRCQQLVCENCIFTCDCCKETNCTGCREPRECMYEECDKIHCVSCFDVEKHNVVFCEECDTEACVDCRCRHGWFGVDENGTCEGQGCITARVKGREERLLSFTRGQDKVIKRLKSDNGLLKNRLGIERSDSDPSLESSLESSSMEHAYKCHSCDCKFFYSNLDEYKFDESGPRFCTNCLKDCCMTCAHDPGKEWQTCICRGYLCKECRHACGSCDKKVCASCINKCPSCQLTRCSDCVRFLECEDCPKKHCTECYDGNSENDVIHCDTCKRDYCQVCRKSCYEKEGKDACSGCARIRY